MPGRRNLQRERSQHDAHARHLAIYTQLRAAVPEYDRALIGQRAILAHCHRVGIRRLNNGPLTWRIVNRWRTHHGCPILRGNYAHARRKASPFSTSHALTSWLLATFTPHALFHVVDNTQALPLPGSFHTNAESKAA